MEEQNTTLESEVVLETAVATMRDQVNALVIKDDNSFREAGAMNLSNKAVRKRIVAYWKDSKDKAYQAHKAIKQKENEMLVSVDRDIDITTGKVNAYLTEEENKRQAEQKRLDDERIEKEKAEKLQAEKEAEKALDEGDIEKAEELIEKSEEVYVAPVIAQTQTEKTTRMDTGTVSQKKVIKVTITDPKQILRLVADGSIPPNIAEVKEGRLKKYITDLQIKEFPGCIIEEKMEASYRGV